MFVVCIQVYIWTHDLSEARARGLKFKNEIRMNSQHSHTITLYASHLVMTPSCISMRFWHGHMNTWSQVDVSEYSSCFLQRIWTFMDTWSQCEMARGLRSKIKNLNKVAALSHNYTTSQPSRNSILKFLGGCSRNIWFVGCRITFDLILRIYGIFYDQCYLFWELKVPLSK